MSPDLPLRTHLRNGEPVLIREIGPADRPLLRAGFDKLSDQTRFFRFLAPHRALSAAELDRFTEENTDDHFAIGAASIGAEADMPIATARFVRLKDHRTEAEFAITIIDSHQRLGLGKLLLRTLAREAERLGITEFVGLLHRENAGMKALMTLYGGYLHTGGEEEQWHLPLPLSPQSRLPADLRIPRRG